MGGPIGTPGEPRVKPTGLVTKTLGRKIFVGALLGCEHHVAVPGRLVLLSIGSSCLDKAKILGRKINEGVAESRRIVKPEAMVSDQVRVREALTGRRWKIVAIANDNCFWDWLLTKWRQPACLIGIRAPASIGFSRGILLSGTTCKAATTDSISHMLAHSKTRVCGNNDTWIRCGCPAR